MNLIKKIALLTAIPLTMASCNINLSLMGNRNPRGSELILRVESRRDLSNLTDYELMNYWSIKFRNSVYSSSLGYDSDGDGIINADEPFGWKYKYGPFVDSNRNGIVDMFDWQIDGFNSSYINNYPYRINERWIGLNLNPFWFTEYGHRYENYFRIHNKYRHQDKRYWNMHTIRDNKKRSVYNTRIRNRNYKTRNNFTKYRPLKTKSIRGSFIKRKIDPRKKYKLNKNTKRTSIIKRTQIKKPRIIRKINSKRKTISKKYN